MPKQWTLIFDEIALGGSVLPLWPAIKAICVELARQGYVQEASRRFFMTSSGLALYAAQGGKFVAEARTRLADDAP